VPAPTVWLEPAASSDHAPTTFALSHAAVSSGLCNAMTFAAPGPLSTTTSGFASLSTFGAPPLRLTTASWLYGMAGIGVLNSVQLR
jgi:hypothetical protein